MVTRNPYSLWSKPLSSRVVLCMFHLRRLFRVSSNEVEKCGNHEL